MKAFFVLSLFLASFSAEASRGSWQMSLAEDPAQLAPVPPGMSLRKMVTLTTDRDADVYFLHLMQDTRALHPTGMFVEKRKSFLRYDQVPDANPDGKPFLLSEIEKPAGVPLFEAQGRKVLIMQGSLNRETHEGRLHLKYLSNGLSMTYETCDVLLRRSGNEFWVQNAYTGDKVTTVKVITYWAGVVTLEGICPK